MKKLTSLILIGLSSLAFGEIIPGFPHVSPDNKYDIGTVSQQRPNSVYVGTKINIAAGDLIHAQVSLAAADIIAMYTTPVVIVAAPGAGKTIIVSKVQFTITRTSTAFTGGGAAIFQYGSTANGGGTQALDSTLASTVITGAAGTTVSIRNGAVISDLAAASIQNAGLYISNATAVFAAGTGTAVVEVWYYVQ